MLKNKKITSSRPRAKFSNSKVPKTAILSNYLVKYLKDIKMRAEQSTLNSRRVASKLRTTPNKKIQVSGSRINREAGQKLRCFSPTYEQRSVLPLLNMINRQPFLKKPSLVSEKLAPTSKNSRETMSNPRAQNGARRVSRAKTRKF